MTFTTHGYHIEGTNYLGVTIPDGEMHPCGGPDTCAACAAEAMRALGEGSNPIVPKAFNPQAAHISDMVEELIQRIVGAYVNSRERSLAIMNIEQGTLWLTKCTPAPNVGEAITRGYEEALATSRGQ